MATTEAPYSFNVKCIDQSGFDAMFTIRDDHGKQFFQRVSNLLAWLPANGYTPTAQRQANGAPGQQAAGPVCPYHGPMKSSTKVPGTFYCPQKMGDGTYCKTKTDATGKVMMPTPAPMPQSQPIQYAANGAQPAPMFANSPPPPPDSYYSR